MVNRVASPALPPTPPMDPASRGASPDKTFALDRLRAEPATLRAEPASESAARSTAAVTHALGRVVAGLEQQRRDIDRVIREAARGRSFSPAELLVLQSKVYTYSQEMDVVSRMVDKTVSVLKTTLNTQV